jgi:Ca2+:H+ antiporter
MSACLLSLSVVSLLLPVSDLCSISETLFGIDKKADLLHRQLFMPLSAIAKLLTKWYSKSAEGPVWYAFRCHLTATALTLEQVLLFVYILYLLFQLKSHAYMYESTPQHLIDEESHPGVLAEMLNASSSSDDSTSSSDTDSDGSSGSHTTAKRFKRALRRKRRKSSVSSRDAPSMPSTHHTSSPLTNMFGAGTPGTHSPQQLSLKPSHSFEAVISGDEADIDRKGRRARRRSTGINSRDFGTAQNGSTEEVIEKGKKNRKRCRRSRKPRTKTRARQETDEHALHEESAHQSNVKEKMPAQAPTAPPQVNFISEIQEIPDASPKRPFHFRDLSRAALPRALSPAIFSHPPTGPAAPTPGLLGLPRANPNIRRTTSLPEMSHNSPSPILAPVSAQPLPHLMPSNQQIQVIDPKDSHGREPLSRTSAILLLLVVTALVAVCAELLVDSIDYLVKETGVSQAFIGLIILPIVGNAAEHVTAVTVASKNKMDLAIGVALGSSIQIAIFVTPLIVLLGWCLDRDMSLYFSLFETISLFASAFIVNYLMIDGRSNYLEGALLIAAYIIIALAAFFYPSCENLSEAGGLADGACR